MNAYQEGYDSFLDGFVSEYANPYDYESAYWKDWLQGFSDARDFYYDRGEDD